MKYLNYVLTFIILILILRQIGGGVYGNQNFMVLLWLLLALILPLFLDLRKKVNNRYLFTYLTLILSVILIQPFIKQKPIYILFSTLALTIPFLLFLLKSKMSSNMKHRQHIQTLVSENKLKAAIASLMEGVKFSQQEDLKNNLVHLSGRLNYILTEKEKGMIRDDNFSIEQNKIRSTLSSYLEEYNESSNFQFKIHPEIQNGMAKKPVSPVNDDSDDNDISEIKKQNLKDAHFNVAVSFPGEKRQYVEEAVNALANLIGTKNIFYDRWYDSQLARPGIDVILQNIYNERTDLVVVFLCKEYNEKDWCGIEWRAIKDLINTKKGEKVMLLTFDYEKVDGLYASMHLLMEC